jgi:hypothetical protein
MKLAGMVVFWIANLTSLTNQINHYISHSKNDQKYVEETDKITKVMGWVNIYDSDIPFLYI